MTGVVGLFSENCVVADTCVLIDFLQAGRMDLIGRHPSQFISTEEVAEEIRYACQRERYDAALNAKHLVQTRLRGDTGELRLFEYLRNSLCDIKPFAEVDSLEPVTPPLVTSLGKGERSVISVAYHRGCQLATDDKEARKYANKVSGGQIHTLGTRDIVRDLIRGGMLTAAEAGPILDG